MSINSDMQLGAGRAVWLVARRELSTRMRSKAFLISTVILVAVIIGYILLMNFIGSSAASSTVGLTSANASLAAPLKAAAKTVGQDVTTRIVSDGAGRSQVADGELDALVTGSPTAMTITVEKNLDTKLKSALTVLAQQEALKAQLTAVPDPAAASRAVADAHVTVAPLEPSEPFQLERIIIGIVGVVLIYMSLMFNGQAVAQGVVEEKSSRVVELLLATVRPWQLMAGKVMGIGILGLAQMVVFAVIGVGLGLGTGVLDVPASMVTSAALWTLVWYIIGFFMYAVILAGAGALVSRQEDTPSVVTPVLMLIMVPAIIGWSVLPSNPDSQLGHVMSLIPLFSPTLMPMRISLGVAPPWEIALSVVLSVALTALLVRLAGRVYRNAVLRTGARVKLSEALRAA